MARHCHVILRLFLTLNSTPKKKKPTTHRHLKTGYLTSCPLTDTHRKHTHTPNEHTSDLVQLGSTLVIYIHKAQNEEQRGVFCSSSSLYLCAHRRAQCPSSSSPSFFGVAFGSERRCASPPPTSEGAQAARGLASVRWPG